jgi:hypothetical protein
MPFKWVGSSGSPRCNSWKKSAASRLALSGSPSVRLADRTFFRIADMVVPAGKHRSTAVRVPTVPTGALFPIALKGIFAPRNSLARSAGEKKCSFQIRSRNGKLTAPETML